MEISAVASSTVFLPSHETSQRKEAGLSSVEIKQARNNMAASLTQKRTNQDLRQVDTKPETEVRSKATDVEAEQNPRFLFEYENSRQIVKVQNSQGVLIYQVPSKGQLALIEQADSAEKSSIQLTV